MVTVVTKYPKYRMYQDKDQENNHILKGAGNPYLKSTDWIFWNYGLVTSQVAVGLLLILVFHFKCRLSIHTDKLNLKIPQPMDYLKSFSFQLDEGTLSETWSPKQGREPGFSLLEESETVWNLHKSWIDKTAHQSKKPSKMDKPILCFNYLTFPQTKHWHSWTLSRSELVINNGSYNMLYSFGTKLSGVM